MGPVLCIHYIFTVHEAGHVKERSPREATSSYLGSDDGGNLRNRDDSQWVDVFNDTT